MGGRVLREVRDLVHRVPIVGGESEIHSFNHESFVSVSLLILLTVFDGNLYQILGKEVPKRFVSFDELAEMTKGMLARGDPAAQSEVRVLPEALQYWSRFVQDGEVAIGPLCSGLGRVPYSRNVLCVTVKAFGYVEI